MNLLRYFLVFVTAAGAVFAQGPRPQAGLIISPREAALRPGEGIRFEAALFDHNGQPVRIDALIWRVEPNAIGQISDDGFFMAGREEGAGTVIAEAKSSALNASFTARALVKIGEPHPELRVVIRPSNAVVPLGGSQQYEAAVFDASGNPIDVRGARWKAEPPQIGSIDADGLFQAGRIAGHGVIAAVVETRLGVSHGETRVTVAPAPTAAIQGTVTDASTGDPIQTGRVWAERVGGLEWRGEAEVDAAGNYLLDGLIPGLYVVKAQARGYLAEFYDDASYYNEATPVQAPENTTVADIDFALSRGATISGAVTADEGGAPIAGAHVFAVLVVNERIKHHTVTGDDGSYSLEGLPTGTYAVRAEAPGYKGEFYDDAHDLLNATLISLTQPESISGIDFGLATASAISGQVVDANNGSPIARARVIIMAARSTAPRPAPIVVVPTDENGNYIAGVREGTYLVAVEARGYHFELFDGVHDRSEATPVQVVANQHTTGIDFELDPLGSISGIVTDEATGDPIVGAVVTAFPERPVRDTAGNPNDLRAPLVARTNEDGAYLIENVREGSYFVLSEARGYLHEFWQEAQVVGEATLVAVTAGENITGIDFTLEKGGTISGVVLAADNGRPLQHAVVHAKQIGGDHGARAEADKEGRYRLDGLRAGEYVVVAESKNYVPQFFDGAATEDQATPVKVESGHETSGIDFKLEKRRGGRGSLSGTIVSDADGAPIPFAVVIAVPVSGGRPQATMTDRLGDYEIGGLKEDLYVVLACARGFLCEFYKDARHWREATLVKVGGDAPTTGIDFSLAPRARGAYLIAGRVQLGNTGRGAENAMIFALDNGEYVASAVADADGNFVLDEVPAGDYKLQATAATGDAYYGGTDLSNAATVTVGNGQNRSNINVNVPAVPTGVDEAEDVPTVFALDQNYPNPFNPETSIRYQLPVRTHVTLRIYNGLGQEVRTLVDAMQESGVHKITWDGRDNRGNELSTGFYLYRLVAGDFTMTRKMVYLR